MAGRIPQSFIDDLVARADIIEVLGSRIELRKAGREYKALCPFHGEKTPSFTVSPDKGFYHCFGCGAHGTALGFLMEHDHLSFVEAVEELAGMMSIEVPREAGSAPRDSRLDHLHDLLDRVATLFSQSLKHHQPVIDYLKRRGIDGQTAAEFRLGYAPNAWDTLLKEIGSGPREIELLMAAGLIIARDNGGHYDRFRDRLMFPIRDARGRIIGFGGRVIGDGEPKYLNSPETALFHKGRELYGLFEARKKLRDIPRLVVVEGYMDVVGLARHGVRFSVATLGTATTADHIDRLFRLTDQVVFSFDGDRAGRKAAWRAMENALPRLSDGRELRFAFMPDGHDPDSLVAAEGVNAFETALDNALPLSDFLLHELRGQVDDTSAEGRAKMVELARPLIERMQGGVFRELIIQALAEAVGLPSNRLSTMLGDPKAPTATEMPRQRRTNPPRQNVMRRAITLILNQPDGVEGFELERIANLDRPGTPLLRELITTIQANPDILPSVLLERFRPHPHYRHLQSLASAMPESDQTINLAAELSGCLTQLQELARSDRVEVLRAKSAESQLSSDERDELRQLLSQRQLT
ncbi:MAG: DNA primase [Pseudomonadota bacterium]